MKIISCCKWVADEQDITVKGDRTLDASRAAYKISTFDLNAIEAAVELAANNEGSTVTVLSAGGKALENAKTRKDLLSRGPDGLHMVMDESLTNALPDQSAQVLAAAAQKISFDLIICGDGSGDLFAQQTALQIGHQLKVAAINGVSKIVGVADGKLTVERALESEVEVLEITLPAVISVTGDINVPRVPAMKAILAAGKKPVTVTPLADLGMTLNAPVASIVNVKAPEQTERQRIIIEGDGDEQIAAFVDHLRKVFN